MFAFTVHTYTVLLTDLNVTTLAFVNVKSHVATPFTASLYVHVIVYVVHHFLHATAFVVNVTLGFFVSYVYVTVHCTVLFSSSLNVTVHVALHSPLLGGVTLIPFVLQLALHAVQLILHVLLIVLLPHAQSVAHILLIKSLYNVFVHVTTVLYVNAAVPNVGAVLLTVIVALAVLVFHNLSLTVTYCVLLTHHTGTCAAVTLNVALHHVHPQ